MTSTTRALAVAAGVALALAAVSPASAVAPEAATTTGNPAVSTDRHPPLPHMTDRKPSAYASQVDELPDAMIDAIERDLDLTPEEFLAAGDATAQAGVVLAALDAAGIEVTGSEMDGTDLIVYLDDPADVPIVEQTGAIALVGSPEVEDYSNYKLEAQDDLYGGMAWGYGVSGGYVRCSLGFAGLNAAGDDVMLTAGHCFGYYSSRTTNARLIAVTAPTAQGGTDTLSGTNFGTVVSNSDQFGQGFDSGLLTTTASGYNGLPGVLTYGSLDPDTADGATDGYGAPFSSAALSIIGKTTAIDGAPVCRSGSTTGFTCGTVLNAAQLADVSGQYVIGIVTSACTRPGDSGGSLVTGRYALGVLSGGNWESDPTSANKCGDPLPVNGQPVEGISIFFALDSSAGSASTCPGAPFPMNVSACPDVTAKYGTNWELMVDLATPVVTSTPGGIATLTTPLSGTLDHPGVGTNVGLYLNGSSIPAATTSAESGSWSFSLDGLTAGNYTYQVKALWGQRNVSAAASGGFSITPYPIPVVSGSPGGLLPTPTALGGTVTGWAAGMTVKVFWDGHGTVDATASTSGPSGAWSVSLTSLSQGVHSYVAQVFEGSTPRGSATGSFSIVGTHDPSVTSDPGGPSDALRPVGGTVPDPVPGMTVQLFLDGSVTAAGSSAVDTTTGAYSIPLGTVSAGAHNFQLRTMWSSTQVGAASGSFDVIKVITPVVSGTPGGLLPSPTALGGSVSGWETGVVVKVFLDGHVSADFTATTTGPSGAWSAGLGGLSAGVHTYIARAYLGATAFSEASGSFSIVGTHNPSVTSSPGGDSAAPNPVAGTVPNPVPGMTVQLFLDGAASSVGSSSVSTGGAFSIPLTGVTVGAHTFQLRTMWSSTQVGVASGYFAVQASPSVLPARIQGADRYATASEIARVWDGYFDASVVFVATGENYPDALSAAAAASYLGAPVLLTKKGELPSVVKSRLAALNPDIIYVLGSTAAISGSVFNSLKAYAPTVQRLAGDDRYATGREILKKAFGVNGNGDGAENVNLDTVVIATGKNFPDALSAAAAVGSVGGAVVLVDGSVSSIPTATMNLIKDLEPQHVVIAGSTSAVKSGIETQLKSSFPGKVIRKAGADRYATSVAITDYFFDDVDAVFFAVGTNFPDALSGAALAGALSAPVILAQKSCVSSDTKTLVNALTPSKKVLLGSSAALKDSVAALAVC